MIESLRPVGESRVAGGVRRVVGGNRQGGAGPRRRSDRHGTARVPAARAAHGIGHLTRPLPGARCRVRAPAAAGSGSGGARRSTESRHRRWTHGCMREGDGYQHSPYPVLVAPGGRRASRGRDLRRGRSGFLGRSSARDGRAVRPCERHRLGRGGRLDRDRRVGGLARAAVVGTLDLITFAVAAGVMHGPRPSGSCSGPWGSRRRQAVSWCWESRRTSRCPWS